MLKCSVFRLIIDSSTRPPPKDMLEHPWIINVMKQEVHMARWIRQVYGWPKSIRRSREEYAPNVLQYLKEA
jgi:mitogen-activated protein kinase kinase